MESSLTSTESSTNERQTNSKRKQTDQPDSEEEINTIDEANNQDMVMEDRKLPNPTQTRAPAKPSTPAIRDNKNKSQLSSKKTLSRRVKTRK